MIASAIASAVCPKAVGSTVGSTPVRGTHGPRPAAPLMMCRPNVANVRGCGVATASIKGRSLGTTGISLPCRSRSAAVVRAKAGDEDNNATWSANATAVTLSIVYTVATAVAIPVVTISIYSLFTTGCGLKPGPGGIVSALEAVSYACVTGFVGWSLYTKAQTGSGLKTVAGSKTDSGEPVLQAVGVEESLAYLLTTIGAIIAVTEYIEVELIPAPKSSAHCFVEEVREL